MPFPTYIVHAIIDKQSLEEGDVDLEAVAQWMDLARELDLRTHILSPPSRCPILVAYEQGVFAPGQVNEALMEQAIKDYDEDSWALYFDYAGV